MTEAVRIVRSRVGQSLSNKLVLRPPAVSVVWLSPSFRTPVQAGWYLHAASVAGAGEERLNPRAVDENQLSWEHSRVGPNGTTDLMIDRDRRYAFYLTPDEQKPRELLDNHLPWPVILQQTGDKPAMTVVFFPVELPSFCSHRHHLAESQTFSTSGYFRPALAFMSHEHFDLGESVQRMVDHWAEHGLIDGGALVDLNKREYRVPWEQAQPSWDSDIGVYPYGRSHGTRHWHYILPDPHNDAKGKPWTSASLKAAVESGEAAAVSVGDLVMLAGDFYGSFAEMESRAPNRPQSIVQGIGARDRFAAMLIDVLVFDVDPPGWNLTEQTRRLSYLRQISENSHQPAWDKVDALIRLLEPLYGKTKFAEIQLLARVHRRDRADGVPLDEVERLLPWIRLNRQPHLAPMNNDERRRLDQPGIPEEAFNILVSNGHYAELALNNHPHFAPWNWNYFERYHRGALDLVRTHVTSKPNAKSKQAAGAARPASPIPARAIAMTAFGLHFLTDAFSAGHMRVPRKELGVNGGMAAKLMHDMDGYYGLNVEDGHHTGFWRAWGDADVDGPRNTIPGSDGTRTNALQPLQGRLQRLVAGGFHAGIDVNQQRAVFAVGSALKQLHSVAQGRHHPRFERVLSFMRGKDGSLSFAEKSAAGLPSEPSFYGFKSPSKAQSYSVTEQDTLGSIAKSHRITWEELALFNFGTTEPNEINEILRKEYGCTVKRGSNYTFEGKMTKRGIFLPAPRDDGTDLLIRKMRTLRPRPLPAGSEAGITPNDVTDRAVRLNHPPLFDKRRNLQGRIRIGGRNHKVYDIRTEAHGIRRQLRLYWHGIGDEIAGGPDEILVDYSNFYYAAIFTQGAGPWARGGETVLNGLVEHGLEHEPT